MKGRKLTAQRAVKLLAEFYETGTPEAMENSFGWSHAPDVLRQNERVYEYLDVWEEGNVVHNYTTVGFGILELNTRDARDTEAFLSCGVFPQFRRRGYWHKIMADLIQRSKALGADFCSRTVNKDNEEHYRRSMREAFEEGSGWVYAGDHWHPAPGYGYFVWPFSDEERREGKEASKEQTE
jgi:GNAT superfamily N-acetyltransferase